MNKSMSKKDREALIRIASMGYGMRDEVRDWAQIGRNAVLTAREALADWKSHERAWLYPRWMSRQAFESLPEHGGW